jgi:hypothetical protein
MVVVDLYKPGSFRERLTIKRAIPLKRLWIGNARLEARRLAIAIFGTRLQPRRKSLQQALLEPIVQTIAIKIRRFPTPRPTSENEQKTRKSKHTPSLAESGFAISLD